MTMLDDLIAAGLPAIDAVPGSTPHFSRLLTLEEEVVRDSIVNKRAFRERSARLTAAAVPNWATWSQADWESYFNANLASGNVTSIANLADAKAMLTKQNTVINALAKIVLAMRDQVWPDLPE